MSEICPISLSKFINKLFFKLIYSIIFLSTLSVSVLSSFLYTLKCKMTKGESLMRFKLRLLSKLNRKAC